MDRESTHKDDTTLHQNDLVSSNCYEVCRHLYDEFDRHVDTSTTLGNDFSSLQEVTQEVSNVEATSDFHNSNDETLHEHEIAVFSHVQNGPIELSHESTQELGTNDALYEEDSCHGECDFLNRTLENKLEDSYVDLES